MSYRLRLCRFGRDLFLNGMAIARILSSPDGKRRA